MAADQENTKTYRGNCHCGAFVYEATLPEITTVSKCDCSLCSKKAYHWTSAAKPGSFKVVKGDEDDLSVYAFGSKAISHKVSCRYHQPDEETNHGGRDRVATTGL
jgi:hypothetical protein